MMLNNSIISGGGSINYKYLLDHEQIVSETCSICLTISANIRDTCPNQTNEHRLRTLLNTLRQLMPCQPLNMAIRTERGREEGREEGGEEGRERGREREREGGRGGEHSM